MTITPGRKQNGQKNRDHLTLPPLSNETRTSLATKLFLHFRWLNIPNTNYTSYQVQQVKKRTAFQAVAVSQVLATSWDQERRQRGNQSGDTSGTE